MGGVPLPLTSRSDKEPGQSLAEVDSLNGQAEDLERIAPAHMLTTAQQAYQLAVAANYGKGIVKSLALIGKAHLRLGNLNEADQFLAQAQASDELDPLLQAEVLINRGVVYIYSKIYDKAFTSYQRGLHLAREIGNKELEAKFLNNIGEIYREHQDFATALSYYRMSLEAQRTLEDFSRRSVPVSNLGAIYLEMGDLDNAERYAQEALEIARQQNDQMIESASLKHLGIIAKKLGQQEKAIACFEKSLAIYRSTQEVIHATEVLLEFHKLYFDAGNIELSLRYLQEALKNAEEIDSLSLRVDIYTELARVYENMGNTETALACYKQYRQTMLAIDQLDREQRLRAIHRQVAADDSLKEKEVYRKLNSELDRRAQELEEALCSLEAISDIGKSITATVSFERIFELVNQRLQALMQADAFGIALHNPEENVIEYLYLVEEGRQLDGLRISLDSTNSFAVACFKQKQGILVNSLAEDISLYVDGITYRGELPMAAMMFQPLVVEDESIGVITVQSRKEQVYTETTLDVLGMLAAYLSIAIQNARKSKKLHEEIERRELIQQELQQLNCELASLSNRDGLTNIANRRHFDESLQQAWYAALRQQTPISLLMIDVDFLKEYNDLYGHLSGDDVINQIARALEQSLKRSTDLVARYGGDEFAVLLTYTDSAGALHVAQAIQTNVAACNKLLREVSPGRRITVSIGIATMVPSIDTRVSDLIAHSDMALYQAKRAGRDCIRIFGMANTGDVS